MSEFTGKIIDRKPVALFGHFAKAFTRLYPEDIFERVVVEQITYVSDGLKIKGYIARPKAAGVYPTIIWNRGGFRDRGALD